MVGSQVGQVKTHLSGAGKHHTVCGRSGMIASDLSLVTCRDCQRKQLSRPSEPPSPQLEQLAREIAADTVNRVWDKTGSVAEAKVRHDETAQVCLQMVIAELHGRVTRDARDRDSASPRATRLSAVPSRRGT
jgi:hypothetical protein